MSYRVKSNYKRLGDYIELIDERNVDLEITLLLGLSISKQFIPSVANIIGTDMRNYKIIRRGQFACSIMQVRRDGKMPVALLSDFEEAIISQAYPVFHVKDESLLLPEYLMMWFSRSEFDRQATFHAVGGVRGSLEWDDFIDFELPIPSLEKQNEIVKEYNTLVNRINLNETLNQKLEETAQALYKHWFVDFEFPDENGNPYKSSGGEMVYCEEVDGEVPVGWEGNFLSDYMSLSQGIQVNVEDQSLEKNENMNRFLRIIDYTPNTVEAPRYVSISDERYICSKDEVVMIRYGDAGKVCRRLEGVIANNLFKITPSKSLTNNFLYYFLNDSDNQNKIRRTDLAVAMPAITHNTIKKLSIAYPGDNSELLFKFDLYSQIIEDRILSNLAEIEYLKSLRVLYLSKLTTVEG